MKIKTLVLSLLLASLTSFASTEEIDHTKQDRENLCQFVQDEVFYHMCLNNEINISKKEMAQMLGEQTCQTLQDEFAYNECEIAHFMTGIGNLEAKYNAGMNLGSRYCYESAIVDCEAVYTSFERTYQTK